ncbi:MULTISPECIES: hypothetical protein [unclassified Streptomyces]|uniref:hypothetical protein n=1 Tax=unclassified Streptomyces TaxID=2593676 RepID=UPI00081EE853|nr:MULTISPECIES: hypothetical protein [unclassified Streptomyces]SCD90355.1 hypothetical protein GA0115243_104717 [Streptomyces sp. ScaeMP-e83]
MADDAPTNVAAPNPFMIGITLKGASGFDAEWLTPRVYGSTGDEVAKRVIELVKALADNGVIDIVSSASVKMRESHKSLSGDSAPKKFENGRVVAKSASPATGPSGDDCSHGRKLVDKGAWAAMFCQAPEKSAQCEPLWRQNDGTFKAK